MMRIEKMQNLLSLLTLLSAKASSLMICGTALFAENV